MKSYRITGKRRRPINPDRRARIKPLVGFLLAFLLGIVVASLPAIAFLYRTG